MSSRSSSRPRTSNVRLGGYQVDPVRGVRFSPPRQPQRQRRQQQQSPIHQINLLVPPALVLQADGGSGGQAQHGRRGSGRAGVRRTAVAVHQQGVRGAEEDEEPVAPLPELQQQQHQQHQNSQLDQLGVLGADNILAGEEQNAVEDITEETLDIRPFRDPVFQLLWRIILSKISRKGGLLLIKLIQCSL